MAPFSAAPSRAVNTKATLIEATFSLLSRYRAIEKQRKLNEPHSSDAERKQYQ